ncbi:geranylgeranylglycerol-phosphate geranylgeranyltransferase [Flavobacterium capsici]|uniref:Geranylgeranylglycerol-phosphate geranylgeranyltransferase n=1 Tax=Flavobacterium capsici TaxID=3075618 RepID=A0AA96J4I3_9FLAO|nr:MULTISPECIES: geranylgeranylglycerol-phosphate geranylgeranyltransferase [unclassified Flavobacterium]WNM19941.1 geranylgeranylglycerol-phosphate geranylgeranyltransferase [Flavobacterium sp. PMR2A8]WNM21330.1 geranylgeranylglycerol-phosphate geranylgeranyltransferase [Flavobacterium sp. PMTSA4]
MLSRKNKLLVMKIISLFSVVRGYNIPIIVLAQYLSAIFILAPKRRALDVLLDVNLFLIVFLSALTIASGYIINNFYDREKDLINRPNKSMLDRLVSQKTKLQVYFAVNFIVFLLAFLISIRAVLFFSSYIFLIWFYSHKLKKMAFIGNLIASFLAVLPFFAILLYYKNFYSQIFAHATFLFLLILIREMIKDLENIKGDVANDYQTIPVLFGEKISKQIITVLTLGTLIPVYLLIEIFEVGYMDIYFYFSLIVLLFFLQLLWKSNDKSGYLKLHNILKLLIVSGVFCIVLIEPEVLIHGKRLLKL